MNYDKEIFKNYYGSKYIKGMKIEAINCIICFLLIFTGVWFLVYIAAFVITANLFVVFPLTYCYYLRAKRQSERQKQWISNEKLILERVLDSGLTSGGFVNHKVTVIFEKISNMNLSTRYIEIEGDVQVIEQFNGVTKTKQTDKYLVPRNFSNEKKILSLGGKL